MNTTPDFEEIGRTVPLEAWWHLRVVAALRLCFVVVAMYVCLLQFLRIGFWSAMADRTMLLLGLWVGLGIYGDGIEMVWRKLGVLGQSATFVVGIVLLTGSIMASGSLIWHGGTMVGAMFLLGAMAYGLIQILRNPVRALRFRQMKKYLRTLPTEKRRTMRQRLEMNFQTLIAEGFH